MNINPDICTADGTPLKAYALMSPAGVEHIGLHSSADAVWVARFGWLDQQEILRREAKGWYACEITIGRKAS